VCSPGGLPCCSGFVCAPPNGFPGSPYNFCCAPPGGSCGNANECCAGTCGGGVCTGGTGCCQSGPFCGEVYDFDMTCPASSHHPGDVCDGATGTCSLTRTGTGSCCQAGSGSAQACEEGPDPAIAGVCAALGYTLFPGQRCLGSGACAP
jgi:hypothetical protein